MDFWIFFFRSLSPYPDYFVLLLFWCAIYFMLIGPMVFKFWIIPKIENRYGKSFRLEESDYPYTPFASWGMPPLEIPLYIFCKYIRWQIRGVKNPSKGTYFFKLKEINYDIKDASNAEIVMSFISIFFIICLVASSIVVAVI